MPAVAFAANPHYLHHTRPANESFAVGSARRKVGGIGGIAGMFLATAGLVYTLSVYVGVVAAIVLAIRYYFDHGHPFYVDKRRGRVQDGRSAAPPKSVRRCSTVDVLASQSRVRPQGESASEQARSHSSAFRSFVRRRYYGRRWVSPKGATGEKVQKMMQVRMHTQASVLYRLTHSCAEQIIMRDAPTLFFAGDLFEVRRRAAAASRASRPEGPRQGAAKHFVGAHGTGILPWFRRRQ